MSEARSASGPSHRSCTCMRGACVLRCQRSALLVLPARHCVVRHRAACMLARTRARAPNCQCARRRCRRRRTWSRKCASGWCAPGHADTSSTSLRCAIRASRTCARARSEARSAIRYRRCRAGDRAGDDTGARRSRIDAAGCGIRALSEGLAACRILRATIVRSRSETWRLVPAQLDDPAFRATCARRCGWSPGRDPAGCRVRGRAAGADVTGADVIGADRLARTRAKIRMSLADAELCSDALAESRWPARGTAVRATRRDRRRRRLGRSDRRCVPRGTRLPDRRGRHRHRQDLCVSCSSVAVGPARDHFDRHARAAGSALPPRSAARARSAGRWCANCVAQGARQLSVPVPDGSDQGRGALCPRANPSRNSSV